MGQRKAKDRRFFGVSDRVTFFAAGGLPNDCSIATPKILRRHALPQPNYPPIDIDKALAWCQGKTGKDLAPSQQTALRQASAGQPGAGHPRRVGKTTLVNAILLILRAKKVRCLLCAPAGLAAKRLSETTGVEAKTIQRLLEVNPGSGVFTRNEARPLECDLLGLLDSGGRWRSRSGTTARSNGLRDCWPVLPPLKAGVSA